MVWVRLHIGIDVGLRLLRVPGSRHVRGRRLVHRAVDYGLAFRDGTGDVLEHLEPGVQDVADEQVVDDHAEGAPDQGPDYGYPEVPAERETCPVVESAR